MFKKTALFFASIVLSTASYCATIPDEHIFSMSFKVTSLNGELRELEKREKAVSYLLSNGFSRVWLESYRHGESVPTELLKEYKEYFEKKGLKASGLITPTSLNTPAKEGERAPFCVCWAEQAARERLSRESARIAKVFDTVLIDDFLFSPCAHWCKNCVAEKDKSGISDWGEFRRSQMMSVSKHDILESGLKANKNVKFIIKYPCWYKNWLERGYSPLEQSQLFGGCWVGTETRDKNPDALQACWIISHINELSGGLCEGGWYDALDSTPEKFLEQARYTILGGARESLVHCYDYLIASDPGVTPFGEKASNPRKCAEIFAANSSSLRSLAKRIAGAEILGFRMLPSGVSVHRFRRGEREFTIRLNTRNETVDGIEPHGIKIDDSLFSDGETIVFFGDSITHGGRYHEFISDYYITRFPDWNIRFVNSGVGGDSASGCVSRIPDDIVPYSPTRIVFHFGMNDIGRGLYFEGRTPEQLEVARVRREAYKSNYASLLTKVRAAAPQASFIYMTPTHYDDTAVPTNIPANAAGWVLVNQKGCNEGLEEFAQFILDKARKDSVLGIDLITPLKEVLDYRRRTDPHFLLTSYDRVHPHALGHSIMAWTFLMSQGAPAIVSDVAVDAASVRVVSSKNADVSNLNVAKDSVSFTVLAKSLPFPVCPEARDYIEWFDVEERLNKEVLRVSGLKDGVWILSIDGNEIGTYTAAALSAGIRLGFNDKTPQYRQAAEVFAAQHAVSHKECKIRNAHYARWCYASRTNVDDVESFRKWAEENKKAIEGEYFACFIPEYCEYWPKHESVRAALLSEQQRVRAMAKPVARSYRLTRVGK